MRISVTIANSRLALTKSVIALGETEANVLMALVGIPSGEYDLSLRELTKFNSDS